MTSLPERALTYTCLILLAGCLFLVCGTTASAQAIPRFEPADCMFETGGFWTDDTGVECGYVVVPERRVEFTGSRDDQGTPAGQHDALSAATVPSATIRLATVILRSRGAQPAPDPLVVAQGGPGGSTIESHYQILVDHPLRDTRDIVLFDQRGTLYSEPNLLCPEYLDALPALLAAEEDEAEAIVSAATAACRMRLAESDIDLGAYNSLENAADVDAVRRALGYDTINFYGVSYGSLLGFHLMRHFPDGVRSVILDGVVVPQINFVTRVFESEERVFREFFAACRADSACAREYPELEARFHRVVEQLNTSPVEVVLDHPHSGERYRIPFTGDDLGDFLFQMFYVTGSPAVLPAVIAQAEAGRLDYPAAIYPSFIFADTFSDGMYNSVICAEDADFLPTDAVLDGVRPLFAEGAAKELEEYLVNCAIWDVHPLGDAVDEPVQSDIPALLLSGNFDPITPPGFADTAVETLGRSRHLILPDGGHGIAFGIDPCIDDMIGVFLDTGSPDVDTSCLPETAAFDFVGPDVLILPLLARLNAGSAAAVQQVGLAALLLVGLMSSLLVWPGAWLAARLRQSPAVPGVKQRHPERWLVIAYIFVAFVMIGGLSLTFIVTALLDWNMAMLSALPGWARILTGLTWVLAGLAGALVIGAVVQWRRPGAVLWPRIYYLFLTVCAVGFVVVLVANGLVDW